MFEHCFQRKKVASDLFKGKDLDDTEELIRDFLSDVSELYKILRPVAIGNLVLQANDRSMADVVYVFLMLYNLLEKIPSALNRNKALSVLERRWEKVEQPLFLLGFSFDLRFYKVFNLMMENKLASTDSEDIGQFEYPIYSSKRNEILYRKENCKGLLNWAIIYYREKFLQSVAHPDTAVHLQNQYFMFLKGGNDGYWVNVLSGSNPNVRPGQRQCFGRINYRIDRLGLT